jgi:hypothetical protein
VMIIVGTIHYMYLQKLEYGKEFSFSKFFLGFGNCKGVPPKYKTKLDL